MLHYCAIRRDENVLVALLFITFGRSLFNIELEFLAQNDLASFPCRLSCTIFAIHLGPRSARIFESLLFSAFVFDGTMIPHTFFPADTCLILEVHHGLMGKPMHVVHAAADC